MKGIIFAALLAAPLAANAFTGTFKDQCSMKASKTTKKSELLSMAKVKQDEAKKIALDAAKASKVVKGGIETEDGCLVYSFHVKGDGDKGQTEVFVDAGDGKVLGQEKEGQLRAITEKPVDKAKQVAGRTKEVVTGEPSTNQAVKK
ncbi:MAG TPA: PepSY domain-containing protein [Usitatibacter sp.]|nr:PepSY domain-containing protein [Usitatibacter sp.]